MRSPPAPGRRALLLPALLLALLPGCLDELARHVIGVDPPDTAVLFRDAGTDADLLVSDELTVTGLAPNHGPFVGGTEVVISGSAFGGDTAVTVGGKAVQDSAITVLSPIALRILTPAGAVGLADVEVQSGGARVVLANAFRYDPVRLDPDSGPTVGGTLVTIEGSGTSFAPGMKLELGGQPMTDVEVVSATVLRAKAPPGAAGPADLVYGDGPSDRTVPGAFTYYSSTNPKNGGLGGGPLAGTLTVSVLNWLSRQPVAGATVVVQKARALTLTGTADAQGMVVFTSTELSGEISVSAGQTGFETGSLIGFDARDATLFLMPIAKPQPGPMPPGSQAGVIRGHLLFGGATGAGSPEWSLVPEPKSGQIKRAYVLPSVRSVDWGPPQPTPNATIDYTGDGTTAWPYTIAGYTGAVGIFAVAGLYTQTTDTFEPYAMGVTRGVVVGPGEVAQADVWINAPLTRRVTVDLVDVPQQVRRHSVLLAVDIGADGLILLPQWEASADGVPEQVAFSRLPPFKHKGLLDASFTVDALLEAATSSGLPLVRATERRVLPVQEQLVLDQFVGVPLQVKPAPGSPLQGNTLVFSQSGAPHDLSVTMLRQLDQTPVWRVVSRGSVTRVQLPDPQTFGLPPWPQGKLVWLQWLADLPAYDFDGFNYSHISSSYWRRWSFDELALEVP